jgi:large subunit ribosomal protein L21
MTARSAAAIVSLVLLCGAVACTNFYEIPIETPIQPKLDVSAFQRILVVGFITGGTEDVDANLETVRLLRSQLRSKSNLRVIEAEVLPLAEIAAGQGRPGAGICARSAASTVRRPAAGSAAATAGPAAGGLTAHPVGEGSEKLTSRSSRTSRSGKNRRGISESSIVTGTVLFTPQQTSGFVTRNQEGWDNLGRRTTLPQRIWMERKFILSPKFIFIDGRTGATIHSETPGRSALRSAADPAGALVVLRADGPARPQLPRIAERTEDSRHPRTAALSRPLALRAPNVYTIRGSVLPLLFCQRAVVPCCEGPLEVRDVFAIIQSGGRQVKVAPGSVITVDRFDAEAGQAVTIEQVLFLEKDGGEMLAGAPYVANAKVVGIVDGESRGPKIRVFKKKRRKGMRRTKGHRSTYTRIRVTEILG